MILYEKKITETMRRMKNIHYLSLIPDLTPAEIYLLGAICEENKCKKKVSDLYHACDMQPTAVSRLMNSLEEKGLIIRNTRKDNRRITDVDATELGRETNNKNREIIHSYWEQVLENVPKENIETMLNVFNEIMDSMENVLLEKNEKKEG